MTDTKNDLFQFDVASPTAGGGNSRSLPPRIDGQQSASRAQSMSDETFKQVMSAIALAVLIGVFVIFMMAMAKDSGSTATNTRALSIGETVYFIVPGNAEDQSIPVASSLSAYDEMNTFLTANDMIGLKNMLLTGQAFVIPEGSTGKVIERKMFIARIRVLEGPTTGRDGWVSRELIIPSRAVKP